MNATYTITRQNVSNIRCARSTQIRLTHSRHYLQYCYRVPYRFNSELDSRISYRYQNSSIKIFFLP